MSALRAENRKNETPRGNHRRGTVLAPSHRRDIILFQPWSGDGSDSREFLDKRELRRHLTPLLETALWAAAGGDVDIIGRFAAVRRGSPGRSRCDFGEQLPVCIAPEPGTPKRLIALMAAKDVPLGSAQIVDQSLTTYGACRSQGRGWLTSRGNPKKCDFSLSNETQQAGNFVVPARAVERYARPSCRLR